MGTDDLFHKRKAKKSKDLKRHKESREPYDKVLIVCEGEKTEPYYLTALRDYFKLSQANIRIDPNSDSSPISVVNYAKELIKQSEKDPYDNVFCVIDRDRHTSFDTAIVQINSFRNKNTKLHSIVSNPCFEYWILLHFTYTTKLFGASGDSPCMDLIKNDLKIYLPDYEKGDKAIMPPIIKAGLEMAVANAKRANEVAEKNATDTPTTQMDKLVAYLRNLKVSM
ncbi:RloB family protein [Aliarcobacter butzleri]|uniref:RloB family protein n=1 Tax=Aliarcobacter butzleri TaxID=28197 RepID=UPI001EDB7A79|nr:RloB family protein [Aliarcobacter butzleri]MCG3676219.1 RloB family protein [Aliarcobacter butzleri]